MKNWKIILSLLVASQLCGSGAHGAYSLEAYIKEGKHLEKMDRHFQAARYYFQALQRANTDAQKALINAYIANALVAQGLYQSASYFFLKAVGSGQDLAIRNALPSTQALIDNVGGIIFKKYLLKYTKPEQYPQAQKEYYLYFLAQDNLNTAKPNDVVRAVNSISEDFPNYPYALFLRGTAQLLLGQVEQGIHDFEECILAANSSKYRGSSTKKELSELTNRCIAGVARGYYQVKRYEDADAWYDRVSIDSFTWPQIQYERAWSAVARGDYNRSLGRLVTYKAPALTWFHDSEIEMLRAVSYLQMCLYDDVEKESAGFVSKYGKAGESMKSMLQGAADGSTDSLVRLFERARVALKQKVQSEDSVNQVMNRFVRSPYFEQLAMTEEKANREKNYLDSLGASGKLGLGGFLRDVLIWRWETSREVGGQFVRDRLATEYGILLQNVSTMDIVKLEMLRRQKDRAEKTMGSTNIGVDSWGEKKRGSLARPHILDHQYYWDFNGEFWADELGDYVFALRAECN